MTVPLVTKKSNTTWTNFELKFVCVFNKSIPNFIGSQNTYIQAAAVPLALTLTGAMHEFKFVCFWIS